MADVAFGMLTYGRDDLAKKTIAALEQAEVRSLKLYLVDNNNFAKPQKFTSTKIDVVYLSQGKNLGVGGGRDFLLSAVTEEFLVMIDDDLEGLDPTEIIDEVTHIFSTNHQVGAIAFKIVSKKHQRVVSSEFPSFDKSKLHATTSFLTTHVIGAAHAIRVPMANKVGGYPKDLGLYGFEEIELSWRLVNAGFSILYCPKLKVIHLKSPDGRLLATNTHYLHWVNRTKMAVKYLKLRYVVSTFLIRGCFFFISTRRADLLFQGVTELLRFWKKRRDFSQFEKKFYSYFKRNGGRLYY